ncbi:MAG: hypothetical protein HQK73_03935 [Desulfamplus sp.]|nr:hypothetical protein [Desulfamplus sp.]
MTISRQIREKLFIMLLFLMQVSVISSSTVDAVETVKKTKIKDDHKQECIVKLEYGSINWTTGVARAKGRNSAVKKEFSDTTTDTMLVESAIENAREHLFQILKSVGLQKHSASENREIVKQPDYTLTAQIKKKAFGAKMVKSHYISVLGQIVEVEVETRIYGDFLDSVLTAEIEEIHDIQLFEPEDNYLKNQQNLNSSSIYSDESWLETDTPFHANQKLQYTGLVIDARGIKFKPVICPVIVSEQGEEIYSPLFISRKYAVERGVCSYICSPNPAIISHKVGNNPVTIKALRKDSDTNHLIVINMSDADRLQKMAERHMFMKRCRVIIIVSP